MDDKQKASLGDKPRGHLVLWVVVVLGFSAFVGITIYHFQMISRLNKKYEELQKAQVPGDPAMWKEIMRLASKTLTKESPFVEEEDDAISVDEYHQEYKRSAPAAPLSGSLETFIREIAQAQSQILERHCGQNASLCLRGYKGDKGDMGTTGPEGDPGVNGTNGEKGDRGEMGPIGDHSETGLQGIAGYHGQDGINGSKGEKGDVGMQGQQGVQGLTGVHGSVGTKGNTGAKGAKGSQASVLRRTSCPYGFTRFHSTCYGISNEQTSWFDAVAVCNSYGGYLADIVSQEEQLLVAGMARSKSGMDNIWIGGHDSMSESTWRWVNDNRRLTSSYQNWKSGEPNHDANCLAMMNRWSFRWHDWGCGRSEHFVCKYNLN